MMCADSAVAGAGWNIINKYIYKTFASWMLCHLWIKNAIFKSYSINRRFLSFFLIIYLALIQWTDQGRETETETEIGERGTEKEGEERGKNWISKGSRKEREKRKERKEVYHQSRKSI